MVEDNQGILWVVYESLRSSNFDIYGKKWDGSAWSAEERLTSHSSADQNPAIAQLSNGTMLLVWASNRLGGYSLFSKRLNGGVWSAETQLTVGPGTDSTPTLLQSRNGKLWVFWTRQTVSGTNVIYDVYFKTYENGVWTPDTPLANSTATEFQQSVFEADNGMVWALYASDKLGNFDLYYKTFTGTWSAETRVTTSGDDDRQAWIMQDLNGTIWIFWARCVSSGQTCLDDIFYKVSYDLGASWSPETQYTFDPQGVEVEDWEPAAIHARDKRIYVFWSTNLTGNGGDYDVYYSRSDPIPIHDVGVAGMAMAPSILRRGGAVSINVTVRNYGGYPETFQVSVTATNTSSIPVGTQSVSLAPLASRILTFTWNTASALLGRYTITSSIPPVPGEPSSHQSDNSLSPGTVRVVPPADVNIDGTVDILDAALIGYSYDISGPSPFWDPRADVNGDGVVSILDMAIIAYSFNTVPGDPRWDPRADTNGDGHVDILDAALAAIAYDTAAPDPRWDPMADLNGDGTIDILDAALVGFWYGASE